MPSTLLASAGASKIIAVGSSCRLAGAASGGTAPYTYAWTPALTLDNAALAWPTASPTVTTTYTLTVTDAAAATATATVTATVLSGTVGMHTDDILAGIEAVLQTVMDGGAVAFEDYLESFPDEWPADADLPLVILDPNDFTDTPDTLTEKHWTQTYEINIYVLSLLDATNTPAVGRALAEAARNALKATRDLGLGTAYWSTPTRVTQENPLQAFLRENRQPRQARMIRLIVTKREDEA